MADLIANVHVTDPDGVVHEFGPGDDVPAWAVKAIPNPKAWEKKDSKESDADAEEGKRPVGRPPAHK